MSFLQTESKFTILYSSYPKNSEPISSKWCSPPNVEMCQKGLSLERHNYPPVSNVSFLSKILEKAALRQITE